MDRYCEYSTPKVEQHYRAYRRISIHFRSVKSQAQPAQISSRAVVREWRLVPLRKDLRLPIKAACVRFPAPILIKRFNVKLDRGLL